MILQIKKLRENAVLPLRATGGSVGYDLCAALEEPVTLNPGETKPVPTGLAMAIPEGYGGFLFARSGLAVAIPTGYVGIVAVRSSMGIKNGVSLSNGIGVIDSDYRGEVLIGLHNHGNTPYTIQPGERVGQLVLLAAALPEVTECEALEETQRGAGGFGSTGR